MGMWASLSVFLDFNLPNATTWFYFSWLLAIALFFKFSRVLSMRNWDVITIFLLVPGLLVIQSTRTSPNYNEQHPAIQLTGLVGHGTGHAVGAPVANVTNLATLALNRDPALQPGRWVWWGYLWLVLGSVYFLLRCLIDLALVQRPALAPNLSYGGLAWLAAALSVCLIAVAFRPPERPTASATPLLPLKTPLKGQEGPSAAPVGSESVLVSQVREQLEFWVWRSMAVLGHLAVVVGLIALGRWHFHDPAAGMAAATFYLMLPYTGMFVGEFHHVWPMALFVWALVSYRLPILAGAFLGLGAAIMYVPAVTFPVWISFYWRRGAGRFFLAFAFTLCLALAAVGLRLWLDGDLERSVRAAWTNPSWQVWKTPTTESLWTGVHPAYRIPIFIAYAAFVLLTAAWPAPKNLAQVIALSAAVIIGIQFWYADQGGIYVLWYLPLLLLLVFRPNLQDRRPVPLQPETDWLSRLGRALARLFPWKARTSEPVKVS